MSRNFWRCSPCIRVLTLAALESRAVEDEVIIRGGLRFTTVEDDLIVDASCCVFCTFVKTRGTNSIVLELEFGPFASDVGDCS